MPQYGNPSVYSVIRRRRRGRFRRVRKRRRGNFKQRVRSVVYPPKRTAHKAETTAFTLINKALDAELADTDRVNFYSTGLYLDIAQSASRFERLGSYIRIRGIKVTGRFVAPTLGVSTGVPMEKFKLMCWVDPLVPDTTVTYPAVKPNAIYQKRADKYPSQLGVKDDLSPTVANRFIMAGVKSKTLTLVAADPATLRSAGQTFSFWYPLNLLSHYDASDVCDMNRVFFYAWMENNRTNTSANYNWKVNFNAVVYFHDVPG